MPELSELAARLTPEEWKALDEIQRWTGLASSDYLHHQELRRVLAPIVSGHDELVSLLLIFGVLQEVEAGSTFRIRWNDQKKATELDYFAAHGPAYRAMPILTGFLRLHRPSADKTAGSDDLSADKSADKLEGTQNNSLPTELPTDELFQGALKYLKSTKRMKASRIEKIRKFLANNGKSVLEASALDKQFQRHRHLTNLE